VRRDDKPVLAAPKKEVTMIPERHIGRPMRADTLPTAPDEPTGVLRRGPEGPLQGNRTEPIVLDPRDEVLPEPEDSDALGAIVLRSMCLFLAPLVAVAVIAWVVAAL
jgi:hypothetical protein